MKVRVNFKGAMPKKLVYVRPNKASKKWKMNNPEQYVLMRTKALATRRGIECNLTLHDIDIPKTCPILGIPIKIFAEKRDHAVSVDRIDSRWGYNRRNIIICSFRANRLKSDASIAELRKIAAFYSAIKKQKIELRSMAEERT